METKEIPGFPGYYVNTSGEVFSTRTGSWKKRKLQLGDRGYMMVEIRTAEGQPYFKTVHRLVAITFLPNPEDKPCVNHKNGIKTDNNLSNLEWCTYSENTVHAFDSGLIRARGEDNSASTLSQSQVEHVCQLLQDTNLTGKQIRDVTGVCDTVVSKIKRGVAWRHASKNYQIKKPKKISQHIEDSKVIEICKLLNTGIPCTHIAEEVGVNKHVVYHIKSGRSYSEISKKYLHKAPKTIESTSLDGSE